MSTSQFYETPIFFIAEQVGFLKSLRSGYFKYNTLDDDVCEQHEAPSYETYSTEGQKTSPNFYRIIGGFHPIISAEKDFLETFSRYHGASNVLSDLLQPLRGVGNIVRGIINLLLLLPMFIVTLFANLITRSNVWSKTKANVSRTIGGLIDGVCSVVRGMTQIITTPLTYFIRVPLRMSLSAVFAVTQALKPKKDPQAETPIVVKTGKRIARHVVKPITTLAPHNTREVENEKIKLSIVLIGETAAGKTQITNYLDESSEFNEDYSETICTGYKVIDMRLNDHQYKLELWDMSGNPKYDKLRQAYYRNAHAIVIVTDLTRDDAVLMAATELDALAKTEFSDIPIVIFGNKSDLLEESNKDRIAALEQYARVSNYPCYITSAKTGENIKQGIAHAVSLAAEKHTEAVDEISATMQV